MKKFQDWKKACEILMEKLFGTEVLARSNVSGTHGCLKLDDEKLEVLKGMIFMFNIWKESLTYLGLTVTDSRFKDV